MRGSSGSGNGFSIWPAGVCSKSPPAVQDGSNYWRRRREFPGRGEANQAAGGKPCISRGEICLHRPANDFLDSTDYAADTNLTDIAVGATRVFSAPRGDRSRFLKCERRTRVAIRVSVFPLTPCGFSNAAAPCAAH